MRSYAILLLAVDLMAAGAGPALAQAKFDPDAPVPLGPAPKAKHADSSQPQLPTTGGAAKDPVDLAPEKMTCAQIKGEWVVVQNEVQQQQKVLLAQMTQTLTKGTAPIRENNAPLEAARVASGLLGWVPGAGAAAAYGLGAAMQAKIAAAKPAMKNAESKGTAEVNSFLKSPQLARLDQLSRAAQQKHCSANGAQ